MDTKDADHSICTLPEGYVPSEDEPFMNDRHREYFRQRLLAWKVEIFSESAEAVRQLQEDHGVTEPDPTDRAAHENELSLELRVQDRARKLVAKIDEALARIHDGKYGYCEETGAPISLKRLVARPIATLCLEAQERHERHERVYSEDAS